MSNTVRATVGDGREIDISIGITLMESTIINTGSNSFSMLILPGQSRISPCHRIAPDQTNEVAYRALYQ